MAECSSVVTQYLQIGMDGDSSRGTTTVRVNEVMENAPNSSLHYHNDFYIKSVIISLSLGPQSSLCIR